MRKIKQLEERIELLEKQVGKIDKFISNTIIPFMAEKETNDLMNSITPILEELFVKKPKKSNEDKKESK